jgi:flagellar biogenesis protein FliO
MEKIGSLIGSLVIVFLIIILLAWPVMWLWNYALVPAIDGVNNISIGQALALMVLSTMLFKTHPNNGKNG